MRTTRRFTPRLIRRWRDIGRGEGRLSAYSPWHQVTRGDPASRGRSHLLTWAKTGRLSHFLSDGELIAFYFATMLPGVVDIREQFPLAIERDSHELSLYSTAHLAGTHPGTVEIFRDASAKHPELKHQGDAELWHLTTDLLITRCLEGIWSLLAVSVKPDVEDLSARARELLLLEQRYWEARGVSWLLLTPGQYDMRVGKSLQRSAPWVMSGEQTAKADWERCAAVVADLEGVPLTQVLKAVAASFAGDMAAAQQVFWQSVWHGQLPLDLRRGWRPEEPVRLLDMEAFYALNPLWSGRSACCS